MNEEQFIEKWQGCEEGWWVQTADRLFWVRSYQMDKKDLLEMSLDYLTFSSSTSCRGDKAYRAAVQAAQEHLQHLKDKK